MLLLTTLPVTLSAFLTPFARHFRSKGWHVAAGASQLTAASPSLVSSFDRVYDLPWVRSPLGLGNWQALNTIRSIVERGGFDLVHVHTPIASFLTRLALRKRQKSTKLVYTAHGFHFGFNDKTPYLNPYFCIEKIAARWTDSLIVINQRDFQTCKEFTIINPERLTYMPGIGVDLQQYQRPLDYSEVRARERARLGVTPEVFLLLMIAEFNPGKRHRDLLEAVRQLQDRPVHLMFAGEGAIFEQIRTMAADYGLSSRVHFLGFRRDVPAIVAAADACVLPSEREGLPRSILEAMAMERLVIGSRIRGIEELLSDDCGLLFPVGNIERLADTIRRALDDEALRAACTRNAHAKVRQYSLENVLKAHEDLYNRLLETPVSPVSRRN
jgi:glycosyltransferase involved in cell wall biosynthesis